MELRTDYPFDDDPAPKRESPSGDMREAPWAATTAAARLREETRRGKRVGRTAFEVWKERRDLVILLCHQIGLSGVVIAEVFGLARSQVAEIIEATKKRCQ